MNRGSLCKVCNSLKMLWQDANVCWKVDLAPSLTFGYFYIGARGFSQERKKIYLEPGLMKYFWQITTCAQLE